MFYILMIMFYVFHYVLCIVCSSLCAFKFPFGHNKVKVGAEVNIKTAEGSDNTIIPPHH